MGWILSILAFLKLRLHFVLLTVMGLGLANVYLFGGWQVPRWVLLGLVVFGVIYPVMVNTRFEDVIGQFSRPRPIFCSLVLATFPPVAVPKMALVIILAFMLQVPSMAFFAQHFGRRFVSKQ